MTHDTLLSRLSALEVGGLGLGCMNLTHSYGPVERDQGLSVLRDAYDMGVRFCDTADVYALGDNERLLGDFLRSVPRAEVVVASKFGGRARCRNRAAARRSRRSRLRPGGVRGQPA
ncbi:aldo/keto reductase, partial [Actinomadura adrarensis]